MSKYIVSARKYRPQTFNEVIGQEHVVSTLQNALKTDHLAHAFLFCGPRGVGKTTCARILATTINCENLQPGHSPCGNCSSCASFAKNSSFNIIELDAASNNSVEHIRLLNDQVRFKPQQGEYKVYIIDEVHMLSQAAFNAFLKTLEEPPPHAIFILATTEKQKILPTILSRCQIFDFKRISVKAIVSHLQEICAKEGIEAEADGLITIAQKSDGALRDALSLFDRLASVMGNQITYKGVAENLNILDYEVFFRATDACIREDVRDLLLILDGVLKDGFEGDDLLVGLGQHLRDLLVSRDERTARLQDHSPQLQVRYREQAQLVSESFIFSALNLINEAEFNYRLVRNRRLHVELALSKICLASRLATGSPFGQEKKTSPSARPTVPDVVKLSKGDLPPGPTGNAPTAPLTLAVSKEPVEIEVPANETKVPVAPMKSQDKAIKVAVSLDAKNTPAIPTFASLSTLEAQVAEQEKLAEEQSLELTQDNITRWWEEYYRALTSPSVVATFKGTKVILQENGVIVLEVTSPMAKTRIHQQNDILERLRADFNAPNLTIEYHISQDQIVPETPKKLRSTKEKFDMLCQKNPAILNLKKNLDLIVDDDI